MRRCSHSVSLHRGVVTCISVVNRGVGCSQVLFCVFMRDDLPVTLDCLVLIASRLINHAESIVAVVCVGEAYQ